VNKQEVAIFGALVACIVMLNLYGTAPAETMNFDLEADDPLTFLSYAESLDNYKNHKVAYMVARVKTMVDGKPFWRFLDAQSFNTMVLDGLVKANDKQPENFTDPVSRSPIVEADYYIVKQDDKGAITLEKLCSYNDLFMDKENREYWKDIFRVSQYEDPKTQAKGWLRLGYHYLVGGGVIKQSNARARLYFERAAHQTADDNVATQAKMQIEMSFGESAAGQEMMEGKDRDF
jgi:hypothetical protein